MKHGLNGIKLLHLIKFLVLPRDFPSIIARVLPVTLIFYSEQRAFINDELSMDYNIEK